MSPGKTNWHIRVSGYAARRPPSAGIRPRPRSRGCAGRGSPSARARRPRTAASGALVAGRGLGDRRRACGWRRPGTPASPAPWPPRRARPAARRRRAALVHREGLGRLRAAPPRGRRRPRAPALSADEVGRRAQTSQQRSSGAGSAGSSKWREEGAAAAVVGAHVGRGLVEAAVAAAQLGRRPGPRGPRAGRAISRGAARRPRRPPPGAPSTSSAPDPLGHRQAEAGLVVDLAALEGEVAVRVGARGEPRRAAARPRPSRCARSVMRRRMATSSAGPATITWREGSPSRPARPASW